MQAGERRGGRAVRELDAELTGAIARAVEDRRDESVRLLQGLVRIPSVTGQEGAVQEVVERAMGKRGLEVDRWEATPEEISPYKEHVGEQPAYESRPNVVGVRAGQGGGRSLLLNAHVDTVARVEPACAPCLAPPADSAGPGPLARVPARGSSPLRPRRRA